MEQIVPATEQVEVAMIAAALALVMRDEKVTFPESLEKFGTAYSKIAAAVKLEKAKP